jgi:hypothetical protein
VNERSREIQSAVYLLAGCSLTSLIMLRMLLIFYGVALHPMLFVALLAALVVAGAGMVSLVRPQVGRLIAACGLVGLLPVWFSWLASVVPEHNIIPSPLAYFAVLGYLSAIGFVSLYPTRSRLSVLALLAVVMAGVLTVSMTYRHRQQAGEYDRPSVACFHWDPIPSNDLVIARDPLGCIEQDVKANLISAGIHGSLSWSGGSTRNAAQRLLLLAQVRPPEESRVFYPHHGLVIYTFDGKSWSKIPPDAATYPLYSTFQPSGSDTMICNDDFSGGRSCTACLQWQ